MVAVTNMAYAQSAGPRDDNTVSAASQDNTNSNKFAKTKMELDGKVITFAHLPDMRQET